MKALIITATLVASLFGASAMANNGHGNGDGSNQNHFWDQWNCEQAGGHWDDTTNTCDYRNTAPNYITCWARSSRGQNYGVRVTAHNANRGLEVALQNCEAATGRACTALGCN